MFCTFLFFSPFYRDDYVACEVLGPVIHSLCNVQVQGQISLLCDGVLSFGLQHYASSEFELLAEELLMSDSVIKVSGNFVDFLVCSSFL